MAKLKTLGLLLVSVVATGLEVKYPGFYAWVVALAANAGLSVSDPLHK